jgi:uncharacterized membrane protein
MDHCLIDEDADAMSAQNHTEKSTRRMARLAGLSYLIYSLAGIYITFGPVPGISAFSGDTASLPQLEFLFRTGMVAEMVMYTFVVISAAAMYGTLKSVNKGAALVAAFCRLIESAMGATFVILKYAALSAVVNTEMTPGFSAEVRESLVMLLRDIAGSAIYFLLIPMAVGGVIYFVLFFQSRYIPRWLAACGVLAYSVVGVVAALVVLYPDLEAHIMLFFIPGGLIEWVIALWLLIAGINTKLWVTRSAATNEKTPSRILAD